MYSSTSTPSGYVRSALLSAAGSSFGSRTTDDPIAPL